jgi:Zn-dependent protease with chaperone function
MAPGREVGVAELESARALLPAWAAFGAGLGLLPICYAIGWSCARVAALVALPRAKRWRDAAWHERARLTYPARLATALAAVLAAGTAAAGSTLEAGLFSLLPTWAEAVLCGACAWAGGEAIALRVARDATRNPAHGLRGELAGALLIAPGVIPLALMLGLVRAEWSIASIAGGVLGIAGCLAGGVWAGVPLLQALGVAQHAGTRLRAAVERAARSAGIAPARVLELDSSIANAFALPIPKWLVFTRPAVDGLSDTELEALAAHELGHLAEPRSVVLARALGALALLPIGFARVFIENLGRLPGLVALMLCVALLAIPIARARRKLEEAADAAAHRNGGDDGADRDASGPSRFAAALARLGELNAIPAVGFGRGGSHPHLYDRLLAGGLTPSFGRPAAPSSLRLLFGTAAAIAVILIALPLALQPRILLWLGLDNAGHRAALSVWLAGGSERDLYELALDRAADGRHDDALIAIDALAALAPSRPDYPAWRAELLAVAMRCSEALASLERARSLAGSEAPESGWLASAGAIVKAVCTEHGRTAALN